MSLEKEFIRDGKRRIIGSVTTGYVGSFETIVRDEQNNITGSTSERFNTTRDEHGKFGFDQHRRCWSLDRQAQQEVAESVPQTSPLFFHPHGGHLTTRSTMPTDAIECPLCLGEGKLKRTEVLDRLGVKDFARVAQLSAEEAFRLLLQKHNHDEQNVWAAVRN